MEENIEFINEKMPEARLSDYKDLGSEFSEWLANDEEVPDILWEKIKDVSSDTELVALLKIISRELHHIYDGKKDKAKSFQDSRFTSLSEMIERGMVSCGALAKVYSSVLRKLGIPVMLIDGQVEGRDIKDIKSRHSWLKVYNPISNDWLVFDQTQSDFKLADNYIEYKTYHNWSELKAELENGKY